MICQLNLVSTLGGDGFFGRRKNKLPKPSNPLKSFNWAKIPDVSYFFFVMREIHNVFQFVIGYYPVQKFISIVYFYGFMSHISCTIGTSSMRQRVLLVKKVEECHVFRSCFSHSIEVIWASFAKNLHEVFPVFCRDKPAIHSYLHKVLPGIIVAMKYELGIGVAFKVLVILLEQQRQTFIEWL